MMFHPNMMRLTKGIGGSLALCVGLGLGLSAVAIWRGFLTAGVIDGVFAGASFSSMVPVLILVLGLALSAALISWLRRGAEMWVAAAVKQALRPLLFERLALLGPGYVEARGTGKVQSAVVDGVEALEGYFGSYVPQLLITLTVPTAILVYLFSLDVWVGGTLLAALITALVMPKLWENMLGKYGQEHWSAYSELNERFIDSMQGMTTLVSFNAAERRGLTLRARAMQLYRNTMRQLAVSLMSTGVVNLAMKGGSAAALGIGVWRTAQGHLGLEGLLIILFLTRECIGPLADLDRAWHSGYMGISASAGILEILDHPLPQQAVRNPFPVSEQPPDVVFGDVSFAYESRDNQVLDHLSLRLAAGQTTALVGASGAGKSTVAALLLRFFEAEGEILINNQPITEMEPDALRAQIAVVSQDTYLFYGTVAENLRLARPDANDDELEAAARAANAHDYISALPQGYHTMIGERGQKLSGGEKQRLAIARALLKDAPILILDEATASVDGANEADIQAALAAVTAARTTLVIAHRLNTVYGADRIYVLDEGRIVETGNHGELMGRGGAYARLIAAQGAV